MCKSFIFCVAIVLGLVGANTICPGAPSDRYGSGKIGCTRPVCLVSGGGLRPSPDPTKYFVCAGPNISYEMRCAPGTCFSFEYQVCVHARDWTDDCHRSDHSVTPSPVTETSPAESTTSSPISDTSTTESPISSPITETSSAEPSIPAQITDASTTESPSTQSITTTPPTETTITIRIPGSDGRYVQVCPGFDRENLTYGEESCAVECGIVGGSSNKYPDKDPQYFQTCISSHIARRDRCQSGTCFHYTRQICVPSSEWQNFCSGLGI